MKPERNYSRGDVFESARQSLTISDAWIQLGLPGEPKKSCKSPFRVDQNPSFSIFANGKAWKDHGSGEAGDVIEFIRHALGGDYAEVRRWLLERGGREVPRRHEVIIEASCPTKDIEWPSELTVGSVENWQLLATSLQIPLRAVKMAVETGTLRFCEVDGASCYAVTDAANRAGEIRRLDGTKFGDLKIYPLRGVDKSWLPGAESLKTAPKSSSIFLTEGPKDYLAALGLYSRYQTDFGGETPWCFAAILGAECKKLHPDLVPWFRRRRVRIAPDGDAAGDKMAETWKQILWGIECEVEIVKLERGKDLYDLALEIEPEGLFE